MPPLQMWSRNIGTYLSKENQKDFRKSGTDGKCIEARELIIMLPPSLIQYDPDMLLKYFFRQVCGEI